jgi:putative FmdB family regulatory protein
MPLYEYECSDCITTFEVRRSFERSSEPIQCPTCQGTHTNKVFSTVAFINNNVANHTAREDMTMSGYHHGGCGCGAGACGCRD